jgi:hypothetical protein
VKDWYEGGMCDELIAVLKVDAHEAGKAVSCRENNFDQIHFFCE